MTAIVAFKVRVEDKDIIVIAGDRMASNGYTKFTVSSPKIFERFSGQSHLMFGYTSSFLMGSALEYKLEVPYANDSMLKLKGNELKKYVFTSLADAINKAIFSSGYGVANNDNSKNSPDAGTFVFTVNNEIFIRQDDTSIIHVEEGSCGCGGDVVLACIKSMLTLNNGKPLTFTGLIAILAIAFKNVSEFMTGVSCEFDYIFTEVQ